MFLGNTFRPCNIVFLLELSVKYTLLLRLRSMFDVNELLSLAEKERKSCVKSFMSFVP